MNRRIITRDELTAMSHDDYIWTMWCLKNRRYQSLGIDYKKSVTVHINIEDNSIIIDWE